MREITAADLEPHRESLRALGVRWVVLSGGEPLMHSSLGLLSRMLRAEGMRVTLLTTGLLLHRYAGLVAESANDVIVSLDGSPAIHDQIRRVPGAFNQLKKGIETLRKLAPEIPIQARCTVQKDNYRYLRETILTARRIDLTSISFLAADVTSTAFNRAEGWTPERQGSVMLNAQEVEELTSEVNLLLREFAPEIATGYVAESAEKWKRIVHHFRAYLGQCLPLAPRCNAPWVSAVVEADGTVRPCFFHPAIGNIHEKTIAAILNGEKALRFRQQLDIPTSPTCMRCVCSLYLPT